ncbi:hypothetical protein X777_15661 [Ooceraea biroi]|uniref:Uncharacterized protein n=1 Tax=Ooceraea biroi TaxID=2015173 RepID=A0A026VXM7_OOCBI|nr:hypothetical protein X777_15661 [Ooceraea biroi]
MVYGHGLIGTGAQVYVLLRKCQKENYMVQTDVRKFKKIFGAVQGSTLQRRARNFFRGAHTYAMIQGLGR